MMSDIELSFTLEVKVRYDCVEHTFNILISGYTTSQESSVKNVINEDLKNLVEDMVRRTWKVGRDD